MDRGYGGFKLRGAAEGEFLEQRAGALGRSTYWVEFMGGYFGPLYKTFEVLDAAGRETLQRELAELVERYNRSGDERGVWPGITWKW